MNARRTRRWGVALGAVALAAASSAWAGPPPAPSLNTNQFRAESQKVLAATWKGGLDPIRMAWQDKARDRPSDPLPRVLIAFCTFPSDDAWNQFKAVAQLYPDCTWAHLGMGLVYLHWKMRDQARAEFETALRLDPAFYPAVVGLGDLAAAQSDWIGAEGKYRQALKLNDDAQARAGLGATLVAQGKESEGRAEFQKSYALWKEQPAVVQQLFAAARAEGDLKHSAEYAEQIAALKPRDRATRRQLADLRFELGEKAQAALEYERLLRLGNPDVVVVDRLITLYRELEQPDKEEAVLSQKSGLSKDDPLPQLRLAELARAKENTEGEEGHLLEAIARDPKCAAAHVALAHLRKGKDVLYDAILSLREAAAIEGPEQQGARDELAELEKSLKLAPKPAKGSPDAIYNKIAANLNALYLERKATKPALGGELKLRVRVDDAGLVKSVDVLSDTVGDSTLTAHLYLSLHDAEFPKAKREPVFQFELGKKK